MSHRICDTPKSSASSTSRRPIEHGIEDVEVAQGAGLGREIVRAQLSRDDEGHRLLAQASVRAQAMAGEALEVMLGAAGADHRAGIAQDREVALQLTGQPEAGCGRRAL